MNLAVAGALLAFGASAPPEPPKQPWLVASVQLTPFTAFPDFLGVGATLHAIPYVDVEAGFGGVPYGWAYWARLGPRYQFLDARDDRQLGWTARISARFGWKQTKTSWSPDSLGFSFAGCLDVVRFVAPRLGLGFHLAGGGLFDPRGDPPGAAPRRRVTPELRLAFTVAF